MTTMPPSTPGSSSLLAPTPDMRLASPSSSPPPLQLAAPAAASSSAAGSSSSSSSSSSSRPRASATGVYSSSETLVPDTERMAVGAGDSASSSPSPAAAALPPPFSPFASRLRPRRLQAARTRDVGAGPSEQEQQQGADDEEEEEEEEGPAPSEEAILEAAFNYRVVCEDGAYVRAGLELSSRHIYTIGSQSLVEVTERCVNNQGLARLRTADGWISEMLNPLSGQRGPIVTMEPLARPLKFRVVYAAGAVVRTGVELSSSVVGSLPRGQVIVVDAKRFSNTPSYRCVPRLRLANGAGWISVRINSPPPEDQPVVRLLGFAEERDLRAFAAELLLGPPMADAAGMIEMEQDYYYEYEGEEEEEGLGEEDDSEDDSEDGSEEDSDESWVGYSDEEEGEGEDASRAERLMMGEEGQGAAASAARFSSSQEGEGPSPQRQQGQQQEQQHRRSQRRRRRDELSSSLGSGGAGGRGLQGEGSSSTRRVSGGGPPPVVHFHHHHKPGLAGQGGKGAGARQGDKPRWPQQHQQHEPHEDNEKIVRALK